MTTNGMCTPHGKHQACGVCRHPKMAQTRTHTRDNPFPQQKNTATNEG